MDARNRLVMVAVAFLILVGVAIWLLGNQGTSIAELTATPIEHTAPPPVATAATQPAAAPERDAVATSPIAPDVIAPDVDRQLAHVRGRCVDAAGMPLAGCTAQLDGRGSNANRVAMQGQVAWHDPEPVVTGVDGHFDVMFAPPSGSQFSLDVSAAGRVPRTGRWGRITPEQDIDLGDVTMHLGFVVRGRVVDEGGAPIAKVGVGLRNLPLPLAPNMAANDSRNGWSNEDGAFEIRVPIPTGTWSLSVSARGLRLIGPDHLTVVDQDVRDLVVTARRMPTIKGVVVDELGLPVKGVGMQAVLNRSGRMAGARSREDGTFTIFAVNAKPIPVQVKVDDPGPCDPPEQQDETLWPWGSRDLRFVLRRSTRFELTVVERESGAPVTGYAVKCYAKRVRSSRQQNLRFSGEHPDGRVTVDRVWHGKNVLQVMPLDRALLPSAIIELEVGDAGVAPIRVALDRLQRAHVALTTAAGEPVLGSQVEVVRRGTRAFTKDTYAPDPRTGRTGWSTRPGQRPHKLLSTAATDTDGRASVFVPRDREGLLVRVIGTHPTVIVEPAVFLSDQDLVVVVPASGGIVGKIHLAGLAPHAVSVQLLANADDPRPQFGLDDHALQADGTFAVRGLAAGRHRLQLYYQVHYHTERSGHGGGSILDLQIPEVTVVAGKDTMIEIDASSSAPATIIGRALLGGTTPPAARVFVSAEGGPTYGQFMPEANGVFTAEGLLPGTYRVGIVVGDLVSGTGDRILGDDILTLAAGQRLERTFVFTRRRLTLTVLQADGITPAANLSLSLRGQQFRKRATTSDQGVLVVDPAPSEPFRVRLPTGVMLGPIQVPQGRNEHAATLTLPASK